MHSSENGPQDDESDWIEAGGARIERSFLEGNLAEARTRSWTETMWPHADHGHCLVCWRTLTANDRCSRSEDDRWVCAGCVEMYGVR